MSLLVAAVVGQFADAMTYAVGMASAAMVELNPLVAAVGPGPALLAKAGLMAFVALGVAVLRRYRPRPWRTVGYVALAVGCLGAVSNVAAVAA